MTKSKTIYLTLIVFTVNDGPGYIAQHQSCQLHLRNLRKYFKGISSACLGVALG